MTIDVNLPVWTQASLAQHFDTIISRVPFFIEDQDPTAGERAVLRHDYNIDQWLRDDQESTILVSLLLVTKLDKKEPYRRATNEGEALAAFFQSISVYNYPENPATRVGCLILLSDVSVIAGRRLQDLQETVFEASYMLQL